MKYRYLSDKKKEQNVCREQQRLDTLKIIEKEEFLRLRGKDKNGMNVFEVYCSQLLELLEFDDIEVTDLVADGGKDIICYRRAIDTGIIEKYYIECKLWGLYEDSDKVGRPEVQKLVGACFADGVKKAMLITSGDFTNEALEYVKKLPKEMQVDLVDGDRLVELLHELRQKHLSRPREDQKDYLILNPSV